MINPNTKEFLKYFIYLLTLEKIFKLFPNLNYSLKSEIISNYKGMIFK